ncbi:MAG: hypothetical protein JW751_28235 [Polyangiaceae bacterium]|nr:hypothetical protein [Polyangiaceae bacterium]
MRLRDAELDPRGVRGARGDGNRATAHGPELAALCARELGGFAPRWIALEIPWHHRQHGRVDVDPGAVVGVVVVLPGRHQAATRGHADGDGFADRAGIGMRDDAVDVAVVDMGLEDDEVVVRSRGVADELAPLDARGVLRAPLDPGAGFELDLAELDGDQRQRDLRLPGEPDHHASAGVDVGSVAEELRGPLPGLRAARPAVLAELRAAGCGGEHGHHHAITEVDVVGGLLHDDRVRVGVRKREPRFTGVRRIGSGLLELVDAPVREDLGAAAVEVEVQHLQSARAP